MGWFVCGEGEILYRGSCVSSENYTRIKMYDEIAGTCFLFFAVISLIAAIICFAFYKKQKSKKRGLFIASIICLFAFLLGLVLLKIHVL